MNRVVNKIAGFIRAMVAVCAVHGIVGPMPTLAQQPFTPPDALIIVQPTREHAMITISFAGKVSHASAKDAITRLGKRGGWNVSALDVADVNMETSRQFWPPSHLGVQTGATAIISGAPLASKGGFFLQPFVEAFRDLKSYKILYWVAPQAGFQGLRSFDSPSVAVDLLQDGGPYRYSVVNHNHEGPVPRLPLTQADHNAMTNGPPAAVGTGNHLWPTVAPVLAIAVGSGLAVFFMLRLLARTRNRRRNDAVPGRTTSRDSHRASRI